MIGKLEANAFYVRDNSVGFDSQTAERLFTPFQRHPPEDQFLAADPTVPRWGLGYVHPQPGATFFLKLGTPNSDLI